MLATTSSKPSFLNCLDKQFDWSKKATNQTTFLYQQTPQKQIEKTHDPKEAVFNQSKQEDVQKQRPLTKRLKEQ